MANAHSPKPDVKTGPVVAVVVVVVEVVAVVAVVDVVAVIAIAIRRRRRRRKRRSCDSSVRRGKKSGFKNAFSVIDNLQFDFRDRDETKASQETKGYNSKEFFKDLEKKNSCVESFEQTNNRCRLILVATTG